MSCSKTLVSPGTLPYLMQSSILLDEGVAPTLLQLLQAAICGVKGQSASSASPLKQKSKKDKDVVKVKLDGERVIVVMFLV